MLRTHLDRALNNDDRKEICRGHGLALGGGKDALLERIYQLERNADAPNFFTSYRFDGLKSVNRGHGWSTHGSMSENKLRVERGLQMLRNPPDVQFQVGDIVKVTASATQLETDFRACRANANGCFDGGVRDALGKTMKIIALFEDRSAVDAEFLSPSKYASCLLPVSCIAPSCIPAAPVTVEAATPVQSVPSAVAPTLASAPAPPAAMLDITENLEQVALGVPKPKSAAPLRVGTLDLLGLAVYERTDGSLFFNNDGRQEVHGNTRWTKKDGTSMKGRHTASPQAPTTAAAPAPDAAPAPAAAPVSVLRRGDAEEAREIENVKAAADVPLNEKVAEAESRAKAAASTTTANCDEMQAAAAQVSELTQQLAAAAAEVQRLAAASGETAKLSESLIGAAFDAHGEVAMEYRRREKEITEQNEALELQLANPPQGEGKNEAAQTIKMDQCMKRATYAKHLKTLLGKDAIDGQDVFHIIANSKGGADHPDNFLYCLSSTFNRSIGDKYDDVNAVLAGLKKTEKAVRASIKVRIHLSGASNPRRLQG